MKRIFIKKKPLILATLLATSLLSAQTGTIDLTTPANDIKQQFVSVFPIILGIAFMFVVIGNLKHFLSDNGDVKKGAINLVVVAVIMGVAYTLVRWVFSLQI
ncbi:MAG: hypothetical protein HC854_04025 [Flavobacterium sp.]|nr:hypothetical protein [Flavobacterium sp.]